VTQEVVSYDPKTHIAKFALIPSPERYEEKEYDGRKFYYDKFDNLLYPQDELLQQIANQLPGLPIHSSLPTIGNLDAYVKKRIPYIKKFFEDRKSAYRAVDKSQDFLRKLQSSELKFVILCIDLVGSTKMSQSIDAKQYGRIIQAYTREMDALVLPYHGYVLKHVGDGLIAYFPEPNFLGMNDNAVDCAYAMRKVVLEAINPVLAQRGLPILRIRIGIDSGEALVLTMGAPSVKQEKDIIGETVNLAAKIQSQAPENGVVIGGTTAMNLHFTRRRLFEKYESSSWNYKTASGSSYPLYRLAAG
jgi:class 3 adenylate cyclase